MVQVPKKINVALKRALDIIKKKSVFGIVKHELHLFVIISRWPQQFQEFSQFSSGIL